MTIAGPSVQRASIARPFAWRTAWAGVFRVVAALTGPGAALAQSPVSEHIKRGWLVDEGLPHNVVNRSVQDQAGYLWLATGAGLTRFDGRDFKLFPMAAAPASMNFNIRDLALEESGSLLLLPASGGIVRYRDGALRPHPASRGLSGKSLVDLFVEPNGTLWLGTENETIVRWQDGQATIFGPPEGIKRRGNRFTFALDGEHRTWVAGGDFFGWYENGALRPFTETVGTSVIIAPARSGGVWISTFQHLLKLEEGRLRTVLEGPNWPPARSSVHHLFEDRSGGLWIATRRDGLFHYVAGKLTLVETTNPLITSVNEDREGNIWVTMEGGGIDRLRPKAFVLLDHATGFGEDVSSSVCGDAHGAIWAANRNGGLMRTSDGHAELIAKETEGAGFFAISVCPDRDDYIWVGMATGLRRVRAEAPYLIEKVDPDLPTVRGLFCSRRGDMWVASGDGRLGYFRSGAYHVVLPNGASSNKRITSLAEDPAGKIWAATREGALYEWADGEVRSPDIVSPKLAVGRINAIHFDQDGALWVATPQGLLLRQHEQWTAFSRADGLPEDNLDQMLEDDQGRLWLGSRIGLFHVRISDLKARAAGRPEPVSATTFGKDEGLAGATPLDGVEPETWKAADGRLWFATHRGLLGLQPDVLSRGRDAPVTYIDEVRIDGRPVEVAAGVQVPAGHHRVDFRFVALNFSAPEKVRVRHQLVGLDLDWIETASEHTATYARLPPGHYEMRALASNQDGVWSQRVTRLAIVSAAAWWQNWWVAAGALLGFTALIVWGVRRWSLRRLKLRLEQLERENALERERARIARDLHDELGGSLTQIRLLAERIKRHADQPDFKNFAAQLAARARRLGSELESIIWTVSPKNNTWDRLASFIGQYALKFFRDTSTQCTVQGIEQIPVRPLRPEEQHNLLAVTKEALNNVLKHAHATRVTLAMAQGGGKFTLVIADDGIGFDPERGELTACNGLNNMRARLRELGGELEIDSAPGRGTTITIRHHLADGGGQARAAAEKNSTTLPCPSP